MPLCPQITITPITVTTTGMTQTSVVAASEPATTEQLTTVSGSAATALATANTALAAAGAAYTAAVGSLQPSANTIVNASNQITAINGTGITVYAGASATTGARVVLNSSGLAGYNSSNNATFAILASTGAASFSGAITGSTITGSTLNINGNAIIDASGFLTATGATITGAITATSGSFNGTVTAAAGQIGNFIIQAGGALFSSSANILLNPAATYPITTTKIYCDDEVVTNTFSTGGLATLSSLSITNTAGIVGGYGVNTDWSPNVDNTNNLGISGSRRWSHVYANNTTITTSDARLKTDVTDTPLGLDFIDSLRPVSYKWLVGRNEIVKDADGHPVIDGLDENDKPIYQTVAVPGVRTHYGLIAQEVKQALDASGVVDFAGWVQDDLADSDSTQSLSYEQFIAPMVKAIQELSARVAELEKKI